jgi:hypothetical protein
MSADRLPDHFPVCNRQQPTALSPRQCNTPACPVDFDFREGIFDIAFGQFPIGGKSPDRQRSEVIMEVGGTLFISQAILQDVQGPFTFALGQIEQPKPLARPLNDYLPAFSCPIALICDSSYIPPHVSMIPQGWKVRRERRTLLLLRCHRFFESHTPRRALSCPRRTALQPSKKVLVVFFGSLSLLGVGVYSTKAQAQQYPILDAVANKVIGKYQTSTCEQLWIKKSQNAPPSAQEQKILDFLHNDPQMRAVFIGKVAPPIANKMFECGMIP